MNLVQLLASIATLSFVSVLTLKFFSNQESMRKALEVRLERSQIARVITEGMDCRQSAAPGSSAGPLPVPPGGCVGGLATLRRRDGTAMTDGQGKIGDWKVRARCQTGAPPRGLLIDVALVDPAGNYVIDAGSKLPLDFNHPKNGILAEFGPLCSDYFFGSPASEGMSLQSSGTKVIANLCSGTYDGPTDTCTVPLYKDILFSPPFKSPPLVIVTPGVFNDGAPTKCPTPGDCCGVANDQLVAKATNVTATGFRMTCSGSPQNMPSSWRGGRYVDCQNHRFMAASCFWIAVEP